MKNKEIVRLLWKYFSEQKWEESKSFFHEDFVARWPQSKEKFIGVENFVNMNQSYPGNHVAEIRNLVEEENIVACTVFISADTGQTAFGTSYFKFKDGKIIEADEYWGEEYDAPENRKEWTVPL